MKKQENVVFNCNRALDSTTSRVISKGLNEIKRIVREQKIMGVHGPVINLFTCKELYYQAVEVTAGNR